MARIRYINPNFFLDDDLADLPFEARLAFAGLWCQADREGRLEDNTRKLKAVIFPYDEIDMDHILRLLNGELTVKKPFIIRYVTEDHKKCIQIVNWEKYQKPHHTEKSSSIPKLDKSCVLNTLTVKPRLNNGSLTGGNGNGNGDGNEKENIYPPSSPTAKEKDIEKIFDLFWQVYPRKEGRKPALLKFKKYHDKIDEILKDLEWRKSNVWLNKEKQYIPLPEKYLNQERWQDEIDNDDDDVFNPANFKGNVL